MQYTKTTISKVYDEVKRNPLTKEEGLELVRRYKIYGDQKALDEIIERNFNTFYHIIFKTARITEGHPKFDDYFQVVAMEYTRSVKRFDLDTGLSLNTYCYECARRYLMKYTQEGENLIRTNHHVRDNMYKIIKAKEKFIEENKVEPTIKQIGEMVGLSEYRVNVTINAMKTIDIDSLDKKLSPDTSGRELVTMSDMLEDDINIEKEIENKLLIEKAMEGLSDIERYCIELTFYGDLNQSEIGRRIDKGQVYVSRVLKRAMKKMRNKIGGNLGELREQTY